MANPTEQPVHRRRGALGAFAGVFTPSVLTILGVIMYLRFGWVVGNVGLVPALFIVTLSTAITLLTALSVSAIATDRVVRVGGAYYMISRALGIETGGAVGVPLFLAQALSVALYSIGFAESLTFVLPFLNQRAVAIVATLAVAAVALRSAEATIRAQYFIMGAIALSLGSLWLGSSLDGGSTAAWSGIADGRPFWEVFAVFFPAVTGIMAGVSMSGDLRDPARAIPRGTLAAVAVGYAVYMWVPLLLAARVSPEELVADPLVMRRISLWGGAIFLGLWGATLSSAAGSILGAPRVLQALARDGVLPRFLSFLGRGHGEADEPRAGTVLTLAIALVAILLGNLDVIAPVLTMFFLTTYLVLNLAAGTERLLDSPSFRPSFRVHWTLSYLGAAGCLAVMFLINALATVVAALFILAIYLWLERREMRTTWGDLRSGIWMSLLRSSLLRAGSQSDPRNWRPHLLVLSGSPRRRWPLIELAADVAHNRALMTVASVLPADALGGKRRHEMERTIGEFLDRQGVQCLVRVVRGDDVYSGSRSLVESYGLGSAVPNTVMLGASEKPDALEPFCALLRDVHAARRNIALLSEGDGRGFGERRRIDVWWGGLHANGGLMMLLAYLLRTGVRWRQADVRVKLVVEREASREPALANLQRVVETLRIGASPDVLLAHGRPFPVLLSAESRDADLILLGLREPDDGFADAYRAAIERGRALPPTLYVLAAEELAFGEVLMEGKG